MRKPNLNKSEKGGVGKSTVVVNLAFELSMHGADTGLLDADIHGPSTLKMLCIENRQIIGVIESGDDGKPFVSYNSESAKVFKEIVTKIEHFVSGSKGRSDMQEKEVVI